MPADSHEDIVAAWLKAARRRAVVSHDTALALYDLAPSRTFEIHLTAPRERRPRTTHSSTKVRIHTATKPLRRDEVASRFSVRITSPARTIADVAELGADPSVVMEAAARALATGLASPRELSAAASGARRASSISSSGPSRRQATVRRNATPAAFRSAVEANCATAHAASVFRRTSSDARQRSND